MGADVTMLINRGATPRGRIVSQTGFDLFATPHMPAEQFGPGASYGYGMAVDQLDGHTRLRHTGGMVSFASALEVDRDTGIASRCGGGDCGWTASFRWTQCRTGASIGATSRRARNG
jgi:CubicO group peptidase (beta-lactamase class C family)